MLFSCLADKIQEAQKELKDPKGSQKGEIILSMNRSSKFHFVSFIIRIYLYHNVPVSFVHLEYENIIKFFPV